MAIEIERKFTVVGDDWRAAAHTVIEMDQGYLTDAAALDASVQKASVRVRLEGQQARLNIKSVALGHTRQEYEYPVPLEDARALLALCSGSRVHKRRHLVAVGLHLWEVDEFLGDNLGLVVAEIELSHAEEHFVLPAWAGTDVTGQVRYYNTALSQRPYSQWRADERG